MHNETLYQFLRYGWGGGIYMFLKEKTSYSFNQLKVDYAALIYMINSEIFVE